MKAYISAFEIVIQLSVIGVAPFDHVINKRLNIFIRLLRCKNLTGIFFKLELMYLIIIIICMLFVEAV